MTMQHNDTYFGRICYEAYATQTGGKSLATGDDLPSWDDLGDEYKTAWIAAAQTVRMAAFTRQI
jgi:hypothetical protein